MPRRNVLKLDIPDSYYHVYARGVGKQPIFLDHADFEFFLGLWPRYLSIETITDTAGTPYEKLHNSVEALCYCLMGNHFHFLLHQKKAGGMQRLMRGVMTSYSLYFNRKYNRTGPLFESRYKASRISSPEYLEHVSRYIHLNPKDWQAYPYSSIAYYLEDKPSEWLHPELILVMFDSRDDYRTFVADYESAQRELETIKHELADAGNP